MRKKILFTLLPFLLFLFSCNDSDKTSQASEWVGTWSTSLQIVEPHNMPPEPGLNGNTIRQIVRVSQGGQQVRFSVSNMFGDNPVSIHEINVAASEGGGSIDPATNVSLTFDGESAISIPPGKAFLSDPFPFDLKPLSEVAITMYIDSVSSQLTGHPGSRTNSYILSGNHIDAADFPDAIPAARWYLIDAIHVKTQAKAAAVSVIGNSITDGRGSGTDKQNRWPDILAEQLQSNEATRHISVLNEGIGGNCVLRPCLGPSALDRFERDVLDQPGVKWLIVFHGVNDIGGIGDEEQAQQVVADLTSAYQTMIYDAHQHDIRVYGATLLPFEGSFYYTPVREQARQEINNWIRNSGAFDAVVDFEQVLQDPDNPTFMRDDVHDGDLLHPNEKGYKLLGEAVDLALFKNKD